MTLIKCPECGVEVADTLSECPNCGFDIEMYQEAYVKILNEKMKHEVKCIADSQDVFRSNNRTKDNVYIDNLKIIPKCPTCGSTNLTKITTMDRAMNIALFGILGNKRKYQWHCNSCKYNW